MRRTTMDARVALCAAVFMSCSPVSMSAEPADAPATNAEPAVTSETLEDLSPSSSPSAVRRAPLTEERPSAANSDRLQLDTTVVTGNRELPKVLYIVPWKKADLGDLPGQPFNTLLDEVLTPVDRDVFRREVTYFDAVNREPDATQSTSVGER